MIRWFESVCSAELDDLFDGMLFDTDIEDIEGLKCKESPVYGELSGLEYNMMNSPDSYVSEASDELLTDLDFSDVLTFGEEDYFAMMPVDQLLNLPLIPESMQTPSGTGSQVCEVSGLELATSTSTSEKVPGNLPDLVDQVVNIVDDSNSGSESDEVECRPTTPVRVKKSMCANAEVAEKSGNMHIRSKHTLMNTNCKTVAVKNVKVMRSNNSTKSFADVSEEDKSQKNAIQARLNRQKKKAYIQGLENQVQTLTKENHSLTNKVKQVDQEKKRLAAEVEYLRSVLHNDSALSGLLKNIGNTPEVRLTSSFSRNRRRAASTELDHDYQKPSKRQCGSKGKTGPTKFKSSKSPFSAGVCLHVDSGSVSIEFCSQCAKMAQDYCSDSDE